MPVVRLGYGITSLDVFSNTLGEGDTDLSLGQGERNIQGTGQLTFRQLALGFFVTAGVLYGHGESSFSFVQDKVVTKEYTGEPTYLGIGRTDFVLEPDYHDAYRTRVKLGHGTTALGFGAADHTGGFYRVEPRHSVITFAGVGNSTGGKINTGSSTVTLGDDNLRPRFGDGSLTFAQDDSSYKAKIRYITHGVRFVHTPTHSNILTKHCTTSITLTSGGHRKRG
jgi:hypothetical protein